MTTDVAITISPQTTVEDEGITNAEDVEEAIEILKKKHKSVARATKVIIVNRTDHQLKRESLILTHGIWTVKPPEIIEPYQRVVFGSQSHGLLTGTEGFVRYFAADPTISSTIFYFHWKNPYIGANHFESDCSDNFQILNKHHKGDHSSVTFYLKEAAPYGFPSKERLTQLKKKTYFDKKELRILWDIFHEYTEGEDVLTRGTFVKAFPHFNNDMVLKSLFSAFADFSTPNDDAVDFEEFTSVLSIMSRGDPQEKIQLSWKICDLDKSGFVERNEVLLLSNSFSQVMQSLGFEEESFGSPDEIVSNMFQKSKLNDSMIMHEEQPRVSIRVVFGKSNTPDQDRRRDKEAEDLSDMTEEPEEETEDDKLLETALSKEQFIERANYESDFSECFGLFNFFYKAVVQPIEEKLGSVTYDPTHPPEIKGWLWKDKGESFINHSLQFLGGGSGDKRFFVVRDGFFAYYKHQDDSTPVNVISLHGGVVKEKNQGSNKGSFFLSTPTWSRQLYAVSKEERKNWVNAIRANIKGGNRFKSYAPVRKHIQAKWYINGNEYFNDLLPALLNAHDRIFIADWYLSPQLYLSREKPLNNNHRLDRILAKKANEGVMIYVLIWNASQLAFDLRSQFVCEHLNALHAENIFCISHPNFSPMTWSHHQKFVVVDDAVAFVGGIDLCYNRYDDSRYLLSDPNSEVFPGRDYGNLCISGESNGHYKDPSTIDRFNNPRMPWHDIHMRVDGGAARDVAHNFIQRWNHALHTGSFTLSPAKSVDTAVMATVTATGSFTLKTTKAVSNVKSVYTKDGSAPSSPSSRARAKVHFLLPKEYLAHRLSRANTEMLLSNGSSVALRYTPSIPDDIERVPDDGYSNCICQVIRSATNWSVGINAERSIYKAYLTAIKNAKHFIYIENQYFISSINRIRPKNKIAKALYERVKLAIANQEDFKAIIVLPVYPAGNILDVATRYVIKYVYKTIHRQGNSIMEKLQNDFPDVDISNYISFYALRNHNYAEYKEAQEKSGGTLPVENSIPQELPEADKETIKKESGSPKEYRPKLFTEQIYIHAKMMIVDDRITIIGSANINDRSMRGNRDSELCVYTEQNEADCIDTTMGGKPWKASKFAHDLRVRLWKDYLAVADEDVNTLIDPLDDAAFLNWKATAANNTKIYKSVFQVLPDTITKLSELKNTQEPSDPTLLRDIKGFLIEFPKEFLNDEQMSPSLFDKEWILPRNVFL